MGALAVMAEGHYFEPIPRRFAFSDENPITLDAYAESRFGDLPPYAELVITDELRLSREEWDALVESGEAFSVVGPWRTFSTEEWMRAERLRRVGRPPRGVCETCWGSCVRFDDDASLTGVRGAPTVCMCSDGAAHLRYLD